MDSGIECVSEVDNADKQLVESVKPLLREVCSSFSESGVRKLSYTVYLTDPKDDNEDARTGVHVPRRNAVHNAPVRPSLVVCEAANRGEPIRRRRTDVYGK